MVCGRRSRSRARLASGGRRPPVCGALPAARRVGVRGARPAAGRHPPRGGRPRGGEPRLGGAAGPRRRGGAPLPDFPDTLAVVVGALPSAALGNGLRAAFGDGTFLVAPALVLVAWAVVATVLTAWSSGGRTRPGGATVTDFLNHIPLAGDRVILGLALLAVVGVSVAVIERRSTGWRRTGLVVAVVASMATAGALVNTSLHAYPTVGDLTGTPTLPGRRAAAPDEQPRAGTRRVGADLRAGHRVTLRRLRRAGLLPPQYFSEPQRRFPVVYLLRGNPRAEPPTGSTRGRPRRRGCPSRGPASRSSSSCPTVLQSSPATASASTPSRRATPRPTSTKDVVAAVDSPAADHARRGTSHRRHLDRRVLRPQPRPQAPGRLLGGPRLLGETVCAAGPLQGGNQTLFAGSPDWQQQVAANSPAKYWRAARPEPSRPRSGWTSAPRTSPRWDPHPGRSPQVLKAKGFTVEYHASVRAATTSATWTPGLQESLPWAAARLGA